mgnify:CR=1 FL=1
MSVGFLPSWIQLASLLTGLFVLLLIVLIVLRKRRELRDAENRKPPHERVKIELHRLKDHGYHEEKNYKAFYSELSDILRRYLERRYGMEALEHTSSEILEELKRRSLDKETLDAAARVLTGSDLVKFAKLAPSYELAGQLETLLLQAVERMKQFIK